MNHLQDLSRQAATFCVGFAVLGMMTGCPARVVGKIPRCPAPSGEAINDVGELIEENEQDPTQYGPLLFWIGEVERFCSAIISQRER